MGFRVCDTNGNRKESVVYTYAPAADAVTLTQATAAASYNLSTVGGTDWLFPDGTTTLPSQLTVGLLHEKGLGGWLSRGFQWVYAGFSCTIFSQTITPLISTNVNDDAANANLANANGGQGLFTAAGNPYGFRLTLPALPQARTLVVYCEGFTDNVTATATIKGQTTITQTITTTNGVASTTTGWLFTSTFSAGLTGILTFSVVLANVVGGIANPSVKFGFAYIS